MLAEDGLSLEGRQPRTIDDLEDNYFALIVTLAPEAHHAALEPTRLNGQLMSNTGRRPIRRLVRASRSWLPTGRARAAESADCQAFRAMTDTRDSP
jgi:hypothetical protein